MEDSVGIVIGWINYCGLIGIGCINCWCGGVCVIKEVVVCVILGLLSSRSWSVVI